MPENDNCPRCGHGDLRRLTPGAGAASDDLDRGESSFLAFMIWPGLAIIGVAGFVPAMVVLAVLGVEPARTALVINLVVVGAALVAALLWFLDRRRRGRAQEGFAGGGETLRFCPWCETTLIESGRRLAIAASRGRR